MGEIEEVRLPGVGIRHDFTTKAGSLVGVISHFSGRRQLLLYDRNDPDQCREVVELDQSDSRILADMLGADHVTAHVIDLQKSVKGLGIDWLPIPEGSPYAEQMMGQMQLRTRTGVSIIAIIRNEETIASPTPDFILRAGDTAVVVGTSDGILSATKLINGE